MNRYLGILVIVGMMIYNTGCASYMSYSSSKNEIIKERVIASGNESAIKMLAINDGVGLAIDVGNLNAITKHPWRQLGAAVLDAGMIYGASKGIDSLNSSAGNKDSGIIVTTTGNNNTTTINTGNNNSNIGNPNYSEEIVE